MHIGICYLEKERNWFHHALLANTIFTISHTFCANICFHSANAIIHLAFCNNRLKSILDNITTFCDIFVSANTSIQTKNRQTWEHQELRYCAMHFLRQDFTKPETYLLSAFNTLDFYQNWDILFSFSSFQGVRGERKGNLHIYIKIPKIAKWGSLIFKFIPRIRWSLRRRRERGRRVCQKLFRCLDYRCLCSPDDISDQIMNMMSMIIIKMITSAIMATMRREIKHKIKKIWGKYHDVCIHIHIILVRTFDYLCSLYTGHNIWFFMLTLYRSEHLIFYAHFILVRTLNFLC